jgi:hypothetical protein
MCTQDQWGVGQRIRLTSDILYGIARSLAYGFSHHNFYMFTGGSNFGFSAADGVTTAYAPDTAVDWLLLRHEPKFSTFAAFHRAIAALAPALLAAPLPPAPTPLGKSSEAALFGDVAFLSNRGYYADSSEAVLFRGAQYFLPNHTVVILQGKDVVFNTSAAPDGRLPAAGAGGAGGAGGASGAGSAPPAQPPAWSIITEAIGAGTRSAAAPRNSPPLEMLALTNNAVDYMYYSLPLPSATLNASELKVGTCGGSYVYAFIRTPGGEVSALPRLRLPVRPQATTHAQAQVQAQPLAGVEEEEEHVFALLGGGGMEGRASAAAAAAAAAPGTATLFIFISAMGLSTSPSPKSCKGLTSVAADKQDLTLLGWNSSWVLPGEARGYYTPQGAAAAPWAPVEPSGGTAPTSWFRALFDLPPAATGNSTAATGSTLPGSGSGNAQQQQQQQQQRYSYPPSAPPQLAYALDLTGATKGVLYVNGVNLGRYNLQAGQCAGSCAPPQHGSYCYIHWRNCGAPTQRYYHVPTALLQERGNLVVLFEETATVPVAGQGPVAPSPPPVPQQGRQGRGLSAAPPGAPRNLATVQLLALTEHPLQ